ncbi:hypothetical protein ACWDO7_20615 [Streptomyces sp. NPDC003656]|uniref:hypothetical protein n=1 Tax=unclassified Streptomyces TaxID=2593676 RepID=UPI0018F6C7F2|nr:hypothetical protein [Streptomyces sp. DSM 110735]MBJ7904832.1 hypothetical protein [Streptomyces sp. DSM 110735]
MDQQYPQQPQPPQQPNWNGPQQPGQPPTGWAGPGPQQQWGVPPQPPKKSSAGKIVGFGCLGVVGLVVILGIAGAAMSGGDSSDSGGKDKTIAAPKAEAPKKAEKPAEKPAEQTKSQADQFKACVAKTGTPTEKAAVKHVTKVTGTDKRNDLLDSAEVYTDFTGGFMSANAGDAKLIASAFTSCYKSDNGLVTVYGSDGDMISNANY